jgi:hypothetical protein
VDRILKIDYVYMKDKQINNETYGGWVGRPNMLFVVASQLTLAELLSFIPHITVKQHNSVALVQYLSKEHVQLSNKPYMACSK